MYIRKTKTGMIFNVLYLGFIHLLLPVSKENPISFENPFINLLTSEVIYTNIALENLPS